MQTRFPIVGSLLSITLAAITGCGQTERNFVDQHGAEWTFIGFARATHEVTAQTHLDPRTGVPVGPETADTGVQTRRTLGARLDTGDRLEFFSPGPSEEALARIRAHYSATEDHVGVEPSSDLGVSRHAVVRGSDDRVARNESVSPYNKVAQYIIPIGGNTARICTATLIGDKYASTAAHCVYERSDNAWIYGTTDSATLASLGLSADRGYVCVNNGDCSWVTARWMAADWASTTFIEREHDYALLQFQDNLGVTYGKMQLSSITSESSLRDLTHYNAGYPGEVDGNSVSGQWGMRCDINGTSSDGRLNHECDTSDGHSGGPVYYLNANGSYYMTGIHSGANATTNTGPLVGAIRDWYLARM